MLRRVLVRGTIAAADVAAILAKPQMNPFSADLQTILAAVRTRLHRHDPRYMFAVIHNVLPSRFAIIKTLLGLILKLKFGREQLSPLPKSLTFR